ELSGDPGHRWRKPDAGIARDPRDHRPQRRREDQRAELHQRILPPPARPGGVRRSRHHPPASPPARGPRHRTHVREPVAAPGRALSMDPQVLILDEPMAGMSADEKADMARYILELKDVRSLPMILIEHDMGVVMDLCDRLIVMDYGKKIAEGPPEAIQRHPEVIRAYIGEAGGGTAAY